MTSVTFDPDQVKQMIDDRAAALKLARLCTANLDTADPARVLATASPLLGWLDGAGGALDGHCRRQAINLHTEGVRTTSTEVDDFTQAPYELLRCVIAFYAAMHPDALAGMTAYAAAETAPGTAGSTPEAPPVHLAAALLRSLLLAVGDGSIVHPWPEVIDRALDYAGADMVLASAAEYAAIENLTVRQLLDHYVDAEIADDVDPCGNGPVQAGTAGPLDPPQEVLDRMAARGLTEQTFSPPPSVAGALAAGGIVDFGGPESHPDRAREVAESNRLLRAWIATRRGQGQLTGRVIDMPSYGRSRTWLMETVEVLACEGVLTLTGHHGELYELAEQRALDPERDDWCTTPDGCAAGPDPHPVSAQDCTDPGSVPA